MAEKELQRQLYNLELDMLDDQEEREELAEVYFSPARKEAERRFGIGDGSAEKKKSWPNNESLDGAYVKNVRARQLQEQRNAIDYWSSPVSPRGNEVLFT